MSTLTITLAGEAVLLHCERALIWPAQRTLLVADVHLGKGDLLRRHGMPVPSGNTGSDLQRLGMLVGAHAIERLVVLGDLVHSRIPDRAPWLEQLAQFRRDHASLALQLVGGNHDRHLRPADLGFEDLGERWVKPPFVGMHAVTADPDGYALGGHIHPVVQLRARPRNLRVPVFWRQPFGMTLPSFGSLTGGFAITPGLDDQVYACAGTPIALPMSSQFAQLAGAKSSR